MVDAKNNKDRSGVKIFSLETIPDYLKFCELWVQSFSKQPDNIFLCFSTVLALNHLPDWLGYKLSLIEREKLGDALDRLNEGSVGSLRNVANGFKHLDLKETETTETGYGRGYGLSYGARRFFIDEKTRADTLCQEVLNYWRQALDPILADVSNIGK